MDRDVLLRTLIAFFAFCLVICTSPFASAVPVTSESRTTAADGAPTQQATNWSPTGELMAQGAGAIVGFGVFSLFVAPQAAALGEVAELLTGRIVATALAGAGAVGGTYLYDLWNDLPIDYAYFWHRGGFVLGIAGGIAVFGVMGYPLDGGSTWLIWAANRATLLGTGLLGSWTIDRWYLGR